MDAPRAMSFSQEPIRIGSATFDPDARLVRRKNGDEHRLRPQSAQLLAVLAERPGAARSKEDLIEAVWQKVAVTDGSLTQCIADIRRAMGPENRDIIQTVPKFGYRISGVRTVEARNAPEPGESERIDQSPVRYATAPDGVRLAWTASGNGPAMLKAPSWITNIEMEARSMVFAPLYRRLGKMTRLVRFDQRGTSLSGSVDGTLSVDDMVEDIRAVADAAGLDRFVLFGPSQGVAFSVAFAARYPDRVTGIIGRGGFAKGWLASGKAVERKKYEASRALIEAGWSAENPECRRFFTARLIPDATPEIAREFDEMQRRAVDSAAMLANLELMCSIDVDAEARNVTCPVLLVHSRGDRAVDLAEGKRLAALLPKAELVVLDDENHIFLPGTQAFDQAVSAMENFLWNLADQSAQ